MSSEVSRSSLNITMSDIVLVTHDASNLSPFSQGLFSVIFDSTID